MTRHSEGEHDRLVDLLAGEQFDQLTPEERAELDELRDRLSDGGSLPDVESALGELLVGLDSREGGPPMPAMLSAAIESTGRRVTAGGRAPARRPGVSWGTWAACIAIAGAGLLGFGLWKRGQTLEQSRARLAQLEEKVRANDEMLADARQSVERLTASLTQSGQRIDDQERRLAEASSREVELAGRLAAATADLENATFRIATFERPDDPDLLKQSRERLLRAPGTFRVAWKPFDLPDAPAEQREVSGDVVWNDDLEQGFLRFVGLKPNDPNAEQYQVWVIDERGMEQKVSGGVFNATAQGEVIVPIHPGIDVRRVAVFAVTIEEPGGTWVPDLRRRVVVAPREG